MELMKIEDIQNKYDVFFVYFNKHSFKQNKKYLLKYIFLYDKIYKNCLKIRD